MVKKLPAMQETWIWSLHLEDPLEKGMAAHSSILAWSIPWTEEPGGLLSMGSQRVRHNWRLSLSLFNQQSGRSSVLNPPILKGQWFHLTGIDFYSGFFFLSSLFLSAILFKNLLIFLFSVNNNKNKTKQSTTEQTKSKTFDQGIHFIMK